MPDTIDEQTQSELLFEALLNAKSSRREDNINAINMLANFPAIQENTFNIFSSWIRPRKVYRTDPKLLSQQDLQMNVKALSIAITEHLQRNNSQSFCAAAIQKIYARHSEFEQNTQVYKKYDNKLKVANFLEITSYAIECAKQFSNLDTSDLENGLLVLKSVDLALNNQPHDRPLLKATHLAVDILSALLQNFESVPEAKKRISGGAKMVQLAISFFTGK